MTLTALQYSMTSLKHQSANRLVETYNQMMASIRETFENTDTSDTSLQNALEEAKNQAVHLGQVSLEEAQEISDYIKRDINDAAEYMMEASAEFSDWLLLDIEIIERKVVDLFLSVADRTRVELEQFNHLSEELSVYHSGEITGPGTLVCNECGTSVSFGTTSEISQCEHCGHNTFRRTGRSNTQGKN